MKRFKLILLLLLPLAGMGQQFEWVNTFSGIGMSEGVDVLAVDDHIYVLGHFTNSVEYDQQPRALELISNGSFDVIICKYTTNGELVWIKQIGGSNEEKGYDITLAPDGNLIFTGRFFGPTDFDPGLGVASLEGDEAIFILKLDTDGNFIWVKHFENFEGNSYPKGTKCDTDGNIYVVGDFAGPVDFDPSLTDTFTLLSYECWRAFITKLDPDGQFLWAEYFGGYSPWRNTHLDDMDLDMDGNIVLTGYADATIDLDPGPDTVEIDGGAFISKFDPSGSLIWGRAMGPPLFINALLTDSVNNLYITGRFSSNNVDFDPGPNQYLLSAQPNKNCFVAKYDALLNLIWAKQISHASSKGTALFLDEQRSNLITGGGFQGTCDFNPDTAVSFPQHSPDEPSLYLWSVDTAGDFLWTKQFQTVGEPAPPIGWYVYYSEVLSVIADNGSDIYTTGRFVAPTDFNPSPYNSVRYANGQYDLYVFKLSNCSEVTYGSEIDTACYFTIPNNPAVLSESCIYQYAIPNTAGCDSIITLNLTTFNNTGETEEIACGSYTSPSGNHVWFSSGNYYVDTITNSLGCDSILSIDLTILENSDTSISQVACASYTSPSGNHTWSQSGEYVDVLENAIGCDSIISIGLTVVHLDNSLSINFGSNTMSSNQVGAAAYQWINCDNGGEPIAGETGQSFIPNQSGNYAVAIQANGCADTSDCFGMIGLGESEHILKNGFRFYPNPTNGHVLLEITPSYEAGFINIHDAAGRLVLNRPFSTEMDVSYLDKGTYLISIQTETTVLRETLIKE